jgi:hypothetical protein
MSYGFRNLTIDECLVLLRLDGSWEQAQEGWEFDFSKIDKALDFLKILHPVRLGFKVGVRQFGDHVSSYDGHIIKISTYLEIEEANETLWHELIHASQAERLWREKGLPITRFYEAYENAMGPSGSKYRNNSFEVEARYYADRYKKMALLC